jgi:hypothetical protein
VKLSKGDAAIFIALFAIAVGPMLVVGYPWYCAIPLAIGAAIVGWGIGRMGAPS